MTRYHQHDHHYGVGNFFGRALLGLLVIWVLWLLTVLVVNAPWLLIVVVLLVGGYLYLRERSGVYDGRHHE